MLLLSGTHSLRQHPLYRGGQLDLSATATARLPDSMLNELSWPLLEQRHAETRLGLLHRIVNKSVNIDATTLMTRSMRQTRKANEVQYTRHMTSKDCYVVLVHHMYHHPMEWHSCNGRFQSVQIRSETMQLRSNLSTSHFVILPTDGGRVLRYLGPLHQKMDIVTPRSWVFA